MQLEFQVGTVLSVTPDFTNSDGEASPSIQVQSDMDGGLFNIPLAQAAFEQNQPIRGYKVLFYRFGNQQTRAIKFWGREEEYIRKGEFGLNPGEVFIQSPTGFGYLKINQDGRVELVSGDQATSLSMDDQGFNTNTPSVLIKTVGNLTFEMLQDKTITLAVLDTDGNTLASLVFDKDTNISLKTEKDVTITGKNIYLDGNVFVGTGASDPNKRLLFGNVVTAGPTGTHPFDIITGVPIQGSSTVKASS